MPEELDRAYAQRIFIDVECSRDEAAISAVAAGRGWRLGVGRAW